MSQEVPVQSAEETIISSKGSEVLSTENLEGQIFAQRYEILKLLGKGGMSVVYRARHLIMDKIFAVKVLHLHLAKDDLSLRRFKQEAQAASTLTHPGIVAIHDCGESEDGTAYLVMDYVQGASLADLLQNHGPLALDSFLNIMIQVAAALAHAHKCGIVHRDLKPSNIMITEADDKTQVKIVDFGIAKILANAGEETQQLTQTGEVFGSPLYMSPEQCFGSTVDRRCDIYSMGCVMYEALSGTAPFRGDNAFETMNKHVNEAPPPLVSPLLDESARQKLELILLRSLAKNPDDRYQSMAEIESELRSLQSGTKEGILTALGSAWGLAFAKRRAARKSKLPLMVMTLTTVSCLSMVSVLLLFGGLKKSEGEVARLEQSRRVLSEISLVQAEFGNLNESGTAYFAAIFLSPERADDAKAFFQDGQASARSRLEKVEKAVEQDPELAEPFKKQWKPKLLKVLKHSGAMLNRVTEEAAVNGFLSPRNLNASLILSKQISEGAAVLTLMTREARKTEKEQIGKVKNTELWTGYLAILCAGLNGAVVVTLLVYFARGTPQRLKKLAEQAMQISRKRGLVSSQITTDEVSDLNNVIHELASALTEAEEREKSLRMKLKQQEINKAATDSQK